MMLAFAALVVAAAPPLALGADEAVARALASHPQLLLAEERVHEQVAQRAGALVLYNPELRVRHHRPENLLQPLWGEPVHPYPFSSARVDLRWRPPPLESFGPRQLEGDARIAESRAQLDEERARLAEQVRLTHAKLLVLERRLALADETVTLSSRASALAERLLEARTGTGLDVSLARLDALDAVAERERLKSEHADELVRLRALIGLAPDEELVLVAPAQPLCRGPVESDDELVARALEASPALRALAHELRAEEARGLGIALSRIPWFDHLRVSYIAEQDGNDPQTVGVAAGLTLPVLDWRLSDGERVSARIARLDAERVATERALATRVRRGVEELRQRAALVALYDEAQAAVIGEGLLQVERALDAAEVDAARVALVKARTVRARSDALDATLACDEAAIRLAHIVARPSP